MKKVKVGQDTYYLNFPSPEIKSKINYNFELLNSFGKDKLKSQDLNQGLVIISTLPNVNKKHCIQQMEELCFLGESLLLDKKIIHISSDDFDTWKNAQSLLNFPIEAYTLYSSDFNSVLNFKKSFGVGVDGTPRIAHGLFAIQDGVFINIQIPEEQLGVPNIPMFFEQVLSVM